MQGGYQLPLVSLSAAARVGAGVYRDMEPIGSLGNRGEDTPSHGRERVERRSRPRIHGGPLVARTRGPLASPASVARFGPPRTWTTSCSGAGTEPVDPGDAIICLGDIAVHGLWGGPSSRCAKRPAGRSSSSGTTRRTASAESTWTPSTRARLGARRGNVRKAASLKGEAQQSLAVLLHRGHGLSGAIVQREPVVHYE